MDKKIGQNLIVGIFVLIGLVGFLYLLFTVGSGAGIFTPQLSLYVRFPDVKGLHTGSEISLSGLRIGVVKTIAVATDGYKDLIVKLRVDKKVQQYIREDSLAMIRTQGVLGDKYIEITMGSLDRPAIADNAYLKTHESLDLFAKSGQVVEGLSKQFDKGGNFDTLLAQLNQLAHNLNGLTADVKKERGILYTLVYGKSGEKLDRSLAHLEGILRKVDTGEGTLGALVNDPTVYEDVKSLMGGAKRSTILRYFINQMVESGQKEKSSKKPESE